MPVEGPSGEPREAREPAPEPRRRRQREQQAEESPRAEKSERAARPRAAPVSEPSRRVVEAREARRRAAEAVERQTDTNQEILAAVARRASSIPPEKDLLRIGAAAATVALTNLESARLVAEQIRAELELSRGRAAADFTGGSRESIAAALAG